MGNKKKTIADEPQELENGSTTIVDEPQELENGSKTIHGQSRQEVYEQCAVLIAKLPNGTQWTRTFCVYRPETNDFEQTLTIINS